MNPNPRNACSGFFQDWLEVNLTEKCNARCPWCVEMRGWHPSFHAPWKTICDVAAATGKNNIILLGGEPTLHPNIKEIIGNLTSLGHRVWVTTNGGMLGNGWEKENMVGVFGVNISIHHYNLDFNRRITGLALIEENLSIAISNLRHLFGATIRLNCNCIKGYVDTIGEIRQYISWAKKIGADKIRFAELKFDEQHFVDLAKILDYKYGLNDNPFEEGCHCDAVVDGVPVNFRQMCGLQTHLRPCPNNPSQVPKQVLYYDGKLYNGWQQEEPNVTQDELKAVLLLVQRGDMSVDGALEVLKDSVQVVQLKEEMAQPRKAISDVASEARASSSHCAY